MAVGFALRAFFLATEGGLSMANYMMPHGRILQFGFLYLYFRFGGGFGQFRA